MECERINLLQLQNRNAQISERPGFRAANQELGANLMLNARDKMRIALNIQRHNDRAAKCTAQETGDPLWTVFSPEQHAISLSDSARLQFARELKGCLCDWLIRPGRNS